MDVNFKEFEKNIKGIANFASKLIEVQKGQLSKDEREEFEDHLKDIDFEKTLKKVDKSLIKMKKAVNGR